MEILVILFMFIGTGLSFAIITAIIADSKGSRATGWFFYGLFLGPIALAHAIVIHRTLEEEQKRHLLAGRDPCPLCDEYISPKAVVCPRCQPTSSWQMKPQNGHPERNGDMFDLSVCIA